MIAFRVSEDQINRAKKLAAVKIKLFAFLDEAKVFRELFGFTNTPGLITEADRAYLRGELAEPPIGSSGAAPKITILDQAATPEEAEIKKRNLQHASL